jgi:cysteine desulfurase/selenocysteine lyase
MSTSDPAAAERSLPPTIENPDEPAGESLSAAMASLPDPAVIARLANEFFAALPNVGASVPARATTGDVPAVSRDVLTLQNVTNPTAQNHGIQYPNSQNPNIPAPGIQGPGTQADQIIAPKTPDPTPSFEVPGTTGYFLDRTSPLNATPSFPAVNDAFSFPGVPGAQAVPGIPSFGSSVPGAPLTEADLRAIPASLTDVPSFAPSVPNSFATAVPGFSAYFLGRENGAPLTATPSFPAVAEMFSLPGVPGVQSVPGVPGLPSSPPANFQGLLDTASMPPTPFSSAYFPGVPPTAEQSLRPESLTFRPDIVPELGVPARPFDAHFIRRDFPILQERVNGRPLVWLDNAATTQKPNAVIDRVSAFYRHENSNIHRAAHTLAARATDAYEGAREKVRRFLNAASAREIVFVRGATEGINLVAKSWGHRNVEKDDEIVITWLEHHANIVPWQQLCSEKGARLRVAPVNDRGEVILEEYEKLLGPRTRIVAFSQVSNALGTITPARQMIEMAHRHGARVLVDGAQSIAHMGVDVQLLDCDFFVFSGHKIFAPTGIGVVFGKGDILDHTPPWQGGGSMIVDVTFEKTVYNVPPSRFEAGTGNIADAVGLGAALDYLEQIGMENISRYEHDLLAYATKGLLTVPGLHLIGTAKDKASVLSFVLDGFRTEDVGKALNHEGIAVRAGHHCAQPILRRFGLETTVRPSLALYNTCEDVDALVAALLRIQAGHGL